MSLPHVVWPHSTNPAAKPQRFDVFCLAIGAKRWLANTGRTCHLMLDVCWLTDRDETLLICRWAAPFVTDNISGTKQLFLQPRIFRFHLVLILMPLLHVLIVFTSHCFGISHKNSKIQKFRNSFPCTDTLFAARESTVSSLTGTTLVYTLDISIFARAQWMCHSHPRGHSGYFDWKRAVYVTNFSHIGGDRRCRAPRRVLLFICVHYFG